MEERTSCAQAANGDCAAGHEQRIKIWFRCTPGRIRFVESGDDTGREAGSMCALNGRSRLRAGREDDAAVVGALAAHAQVICAYTLDVQGQRYWLWRHVGHAQLYVMCVLNL